MKKIVLFSLIFAAFMGCDGVVSLQTDVVVQDQGAEDAFIATDTAADMAADTGTVTDTSVDTTTDTVTDISTAPKGTYAFFEPDTTQWGGLPYPGDYMLDASGHIMFKTFPNPDNKDLIEAYLAEISANIDGFSPTQTVYISFSSTVDTSGLKTEYLPVNQSVIVMVDVTKGEHYGEKVPMLWKYQREKTKFWASNTLAVKPVWGIVLHEGDTYAVYVTNALNDQKGKKLAVNPKFQACLTGDPSCPARFVSAMKPLSDYLKDQGISEDTVIGGTAFTIAHPRAELLAIRDYIDAQPAPNVKDIQKSGSTSIYTRYEGHYTAPNFLHGKPPYRTTGGGFEFNEDGTPKVAYMENMRFVLTIPSSPASNPMPIAVVMHGTGGDYHTFLRSGPYNPAKKLSKAGIACIGIDEPIHGTRVDPPLSQDDVDLYSFNVFNPTAGRTVQRQSIADEITLLRMIRAGKLDTAKYKFDKTKVLFWGHSQGGISGAMLFGVEDRFAGGVLSGAGAGLTNAILDRQINVGGSDLDAKDAISIIFNLPKAMIDQFHPVMTMAQHAVDVSDPNSYTPFYFKTWSKDGRPRQIFMTQGMKDIDSPPSVAETMIAGAGLPVVSPACQISTGMALKGITGVDSTIKANIQGKYTAGAMQFCDYGHFAVFDYSTAACTYQQFMQGLAHGQTPTIEACN